MDEPVPEVHVVVAGLLRRGGRALLVHRCAQRRWYPDAWDLPGGHVQAGEAPHQALARELREELGITATVVGEPLTRVQGTDFRMLIWGVDRWRGQPANRDPREHDALAWVDADQARGLRLAHPRLLQLLQAAL